MMSHNFGSDAVGHTINKLAQKSEGLLLKYKRQPYYTSGYWRSVHDRDYQLMLDLTGNLDAPL